MHLYSTCSVYAATSRYEPFGLAPVEAGLSKCALIANDIPSFRELWGDSALFFRRNDPDALAMPSKRFAEHPPLRRLYAEEAYERARARFNSHRMVDDYEGLYKTLVRGGRVMSTPLRLRLFAHSWRSDWNHGNAHFLRGLADELRGIRPRSPMLRTRERLVVCQPVEGTAGGTISRTISAQRSRI